MAWLVRGRPGGPAVDRFRGGVGCGRSAAALGAEGLATLDHACPADVRSPRLRSGFRRLSEPTAELSHGRSIDPTAAASRGGAFIDLARSALVARAREVHAMSYPNADDVHVADLGEGVELAVIGVPPAQRLLLEANYGYLLISNGVPIGYGGVSPLFRQANTGINVFDPFRGSEAAFLWAQTLRAFRTLFGTRRFVINGYQFGAGNSEAIASGAYWFYYRLGFRPSLAENASLAAAEAERLQPIRASEPGPHCCDSWPAAT